MPLWQRPVLCDPQTSGGLVVAVAADRARAVLAKTQAAGFARAVIVAHPEVGGAGLVVG